MKQFLLIARNEYKQHVLRRGFLLVTFLTPLIMVGLMIALAVAILLMIVTQEHESHIGYVDYTALITQQAIDTTTKHYDAKQQQHTAEASVVFTAYPTREIARQAFAHGDIDTYVVIPADFMDEGTITVYGSHKLSERSTSRLQMIMRLSMITDIPKDVVHRILNNTASITYRQVVVPTDVSSTHTTDDEDDTTSVVLQSKNPTQAKQLFAVAFAFGMLFTMTVFSSSTYLLQGLLDEKENRTFEIILTSVTPQQFIAGKVIGLGSLGITQTVVWLLYAIVPLSVFVWLSNEMQHVLYDIATTLIPVIIVGFIPTYLLYAAIIIGIGGVVRSVQEGQQWASLVLFVGMLPIYAMPLIEQSPNGIAAVVMSFLPTTAVITLLVRAAIIEVPFWQFVLSFVLLVGTDFILLQFAAYLFRFGLFRFGTKASSRNKQLLYKLQYAITTRLFAKKQ